MKEKTLNLLDETREQVEQERYVEAERAINIIRLWIQALAHEKRTGKTLKEQNNIFPLDYEHD